MGLAVFATNDLGITVTQMDTQETIISSVPEKISKATKGFQQQVLQAAELLFPGFLDSDASGLYPESLAPLSAERYDVVVSTIRPAFDLLAQEIGFEAGSDSYNFYWDMFVDRLVPKTVALAGSLLGDMNLPTEKRYIAEEIAALTYANNTLIDKLARLNPDASKALVAKMAEAAAQTDVSKDSSGFLGVLNKISTNDRDFDHLKQVIITLPMVIPSRFDLREIEPTVEEIAQIKMHASGYEICTWAAAHTMNSEGLFTDSPRDIYEIMESPEYKQLNNLGAVITRIADDIGDLKENEELGIFNVMNGEHKEQVIEEFCRISGVDSEGIDMSNDDATLQSFVDIFKVKIAVQLSREDLPASERQLLKIFMRTAVIVYVNRVGDVALTA